MLTTHAVIKIIKIFTHYVFIFKNVFIFSDDVSDKTKKDYDPLIAKKLDQVDAEYSFILSEPKSLHADLRKQIRSFYQMMVMSHLQSSVDIQSELTQHFYQNVLDLLNNNYSYDGNLLSIK